MEFFVKKRLKSEQSALAIFCCKRMKATNKQDRFETCFKDPEMWFGSGSNIENCTIRL